MLCNQAFTPVFGSDRAVVSVKKMAITTCVIILIPLPCKEESADFVRGRARPLAMRATGVELSQQGVAATGITVLSPSGNLPTTRGMGSYSTRKTPLAFPFPCPAARSVTLPCPVTLTLPATNCASNFPWPEILKLAHFA